MNKELAKRFYSDMYKIRRFEQEVFEFYKTGQMAGLAHLYIGEEAGGGRARPTWPLWPPAPAPPLRRGTTSPLPTVGTAIWWPGGPTWAA